MNWLESIEEAIDYMESHLKDDFSIEDVASHVYMSSGYFQKAFSMLCGFTVSEYIRNRRLAEAGMELLSSNEKIIDIALMYGYDSHDSFTKAFSRFHGVTPSAVRRGGCTLKAFAPLRLQFILGGGYSVKEMSRAGPKKGAQNQPCQPRSFQGMSEKEEKFKQNQVQ